MIGPKAFLVDSKHPAHQRLRLGKPVGGLEQLSQVVQAVGIARVIFAVMRFCARNISLGQMKSFFILPGLIQSEDSIVESIKLGVAPRACQSGLQRSNEAERKTQPQCDRSPWHGTPI
jgi:hypothetical protein